MPRHLYNLLAAVSLLACVAVCVLWVRSYGAGDSYALTRYRSYEAVSASGRVVLLTATPCTLSLADDQSYRTALPAGYAPRPSL